MIWGAALWALKGERPGGGGGDVICKQETGKSKLGFVHVCKNIGCVCCEHKLVFSDFVSVHMVKFCAKQEEGMLRH